MDQDKIVVVNPDKCQPKKCNLECKRKCPVNSAGRECVVVTRESIIAKIYESQCILCKSCIRECPFKAIKIVNLPKGMDKDLVYRYGMNSFKLHRLPIPRPGQILGLVGSNGIGKTTAIRILSGKIRPNFGMVNGVTDQEIINHFKGSELQSYFSRLYDNTLEVSIKPQHVLEIPKHFTGTISSCINMETSPIPNLLEMLDLTKLLDRNIEDLSGGELQRFAIAYAITCPANVYIFDEPTTYLDVRQRIVIARIIRQLANSSHYIIVIEHDLSVLDYLSDSICLFYGDAGAYGVVTTPISVSQAINIYLDGYIPTENVKFRDSSFTFRIQEIDNLDKTTNTTSTQYPAMTKTYDAHFQLTIEAGFLADSEITVMLGQNGTGKSTFIKLMAGIIKPDDGMEITPWNCSYKPQILVPKFEGSIRELFYTKIKTAFLDPQFQSEVIKPLKMDDLLDNKLMNSSGGELQRVAIILCLGKNTDVYLLDEPSAYLDSEQRIIVSKVIRQFIVNRKKRAFIVEHDFIMATYLADRVINFTGNPSIACHAKAPEKMSIGMNSFLEELNVTFRHDPTNYRPRINKPDSVKDREQKVAKKYFLV
jgi:ATP-binding cassette, sub-family E, member 1